MRNKQVQAPFHRPSRFIATQPLRRPATAPAPLGAMSYADYRTGAGRRPAAATPARDPGAYDSFAGAAAAAARSTRPHSTPVAASTPPPTAGASVTRMYSTTSTSRVDNPYATNAYASSRGSSSVRPSDSAGPGSAGPGAPEFYLSSRAKGNRQGKIKDTIKNTMAAAKQDNWKVVCVKATNHDIAAPKGKHVRVIMQGLEWGGSITNRESPAGGIFYHLRKRMMQNEWVVAVKAQTIFHHIFREGNVKFVEYISTNARSVFRMEFFGDATSDGFAHAGFIKTYGSYIEQWLAMKAAIRFPVGKSREDDPTNSARYRESPIEELLAALPLMMDTLETLFSIELAGQIKFSAVATPAFSMILRDLTLIWVALSEGMIRLLDLYFELQIPKATIALDVYKRFVGLVDKAQPFFDIARSLNVRWQSPQLGSISLDLLDSMQQYLSIGPQEPDADRRLSDEEVYEPEPAPEPERYYVPEPQFYSSSEEDEPIREPTPPPSESSSESESSESEEEEEEPAPLPMAPPPPPPPQPKKFDPLADLLGITDGVHGPASAASTNGVTNGGVTQHNQLTLYSGGAPALMQRAALEHTVDDRVANVKGMMTGAAQQTTVRSGFGVDGTNMQMAMFGAHQPQMAAQQQQQQMLALQQQQQQLATYQTMAAYQSMAMYQSMAAGVNPALVMQQQAMQAQAAQAQRGLMAGAAYTPNHSAPAAVPAMQAQPAAHAPANYRVQRTAQKTRVSDSDAAFGPLLDQMKKAPSVGK